MKAAVLHQVGKPFEVTDVDLEAPRAGEVLVRIRATGVCHSDWHVATGTTRHPLPVVLGHEGAGVVEEVGPGVTRVAPGDAVILNWAPDCGSCFYCLRGRPSLCETFVGPIWAGTMLDGTPRLRLHGRPVYHFSGLATFAEQAVVPEQACVKVRADVPWEVACLVGCAVTTGVGAAFYSAPVEPGDQVVVFGGGGVGLNIVQAAALRGAASVLLVDPVPQKHVEARRFGATGGLAPGPEALAEIRRRSGGRGADVVFEAVGDPRVQEQALEAVRPGGTLALVGLAAMGSGTNLPGALITRQEKRVVGSYYGSASTQRDFPLILDLYRSGKLKLEELVSRRYRLEEINEAYRALLAGELVRGVIVLPGAHES